MGFPSHVFLRCRYQAGVRVAVLVARRHVHISPSEQHVTSMPGRLEVVLILVKVKVAVLV
jgi:hypothetical protein